jgi:hypothetical protein
MKKLLLFICILIYSSLVQGQQSSKEVVNGEILGDTNNVTIVKLWGTSHERFYAQGYLLADGIYESVSEAVVHLGAAYQTARNMMIDGQTFAIDSLYQSDAKRVIAGMADAGFDTTFIDYIDILVANSVFDVGNYFGKSFMMNCSALMSWGEATEGTDINGSSVITRHFDGADYLEGLIDNAVIIIHDPAEANLQPWLMVGYAGQITPTAAGINQHGVAVVHNIMNGGNAMYNKAYEPHQFAMRKAIETFDYNGDGYNNTEDIRAAVNSNLQGYAVGFIINGIARFDPDSDSLTATITEIAPQPEVITFRTNSYDDLIPGDNIYAANNPIARNNAHSYCTRYYNVVNHIGDGTGIGTAESWALMKNYSHQSIWSYMFLQYIPGWDVLNLSVLRDSANAWELDSTRFYLRDFFNHSPKFTSVPDTLATTGEIYNYEIFVADPDPFDTISIIAEEIPDWLIISDNGNGTASLSGTPDQPGIFEVMLKASDGLSDTIQEFIIDAITVYIPEANNSNILIYPTIFSDNIFVEIDKEAELNIYSSTGKHIKQIHLNDDRNEIDLSAVPSGIYYCVVSVGNNQITYKTIKY